jgi:HlyD family secretion protein
VKNWRLWAALGVAVLLAAAGIAGAYVWWLADPISPPRDATLVTVERGPLTVSVQAYGAVASANQTTLTFGIGGRVQEVRVNEGDVVHKGDVLARLETTDLQMGVARAQAGLALSQAQLARVRVKPTEVEIEAAQAALAAAQARYERVKSGPMAAEIASAEAALASAEASYAELRKGPTAEERAVLQANVDKAQAAVKLAQQAYDRIGWRPGAGATPQGQALEKATIDYQQALASYNLAIVGPSADQTQRAQAQIAQARAQLEKVRTEGADDELKSAAAQVVRAQADLDDLQDSPTAEELAIAQAQVDQAQLALKQANSQIESATLVAPTDGTVVAVTANTGQTVAATAPIIAVTDLNTLKLEAQVHETYIGQVRTGQRATVELDALPGQVFEGQVREVAPLPSMSGGIVSYPVAITLGEMDASVRPGMIARATIIISEKGDVVLVPKGALQNHDGRWIARVSRDGRLEDVEVQLGARQGRMVEVLGGLSAGDQVAVNTIPLVEE